MIHSRTTSSRAETSSEIDTGRWFAAARECSLYGVGFADDLVELYLLPLSIGHVRQVSVPGGLVWYSWLRWNGLFPIPAPPEVWRSTEGTPWCSDFWVEPGISALVSRRAAVKDARDAGIVEPNERIQFRNAYSGRVGFIGGQDGR